MSSEDNNKILNLANKISLFLLLFLFLPITSFAVDPNNMDVSVLKQGLFTPPLTDLSMNYLGQMFGSVGTVLHGTSGSQLLSYVFVVFNLGIWVLAGCYVMYTVLSSVINAAHEGEFMGKKMNSMVPIRVVAGVAALLPKFSGYSFVQVIVMWVVVQGVGLADSVWNSAIDYFHNGGTVYQRTPLNGTASFDAGSGNSGGVIDTLKGMTDILNAEICMYTLQNAAKVANKSASTPAPISQGYYITPGVSVSFGNDANHSLCGVISYINTASKNMDITAAVESARINLASLAYSIANQQQINKPETCLKSSNTEVTQGNYCPESSALVGALSDYLSTITMLRQQQNTAASGEPDAFAKAESEGWILAGKYYQAMAYANINSGAQGQLLTANDYRVPILSPTPYQISPTPVPSANSALKTVLNTLDPTSLGKLKIAISTTEGSVSDPSQLGQAGYYGQAKSIAAVLYPPNIASSANCAEGATYDAGSNCDIQQKITDLDHRYLTEQLDIAGNNVIDRDVFRLMQSPIKAWFETVLSPGSIDYQDPVARVRMMGLKMIAAANKFWSDTTSDVFMILGVSAGITTATLMALAFPYGSLDSTPIGGTKGANLMSATSTAIQMAFQIIMARVFWYLPLGIALSTPIFILGATLAVYIPFVPFMLFMFAALGWFISVLEAMVAAPLVALGLTHPEGHDLLGKAEQSIMLLLGVFLKPVLLVTGLLAGIILTFVAANLLDAGFFHLMYSQLTNHDNVSGGTQFVVIIGMLVIYTMAMMAIVDQCFSLIYVLSDKTLRWIGGHPEQSAEGGMLQQVKSGYEGKVGEGAQAGGQQVSAVKGSGITAQAPPQMAKKEKGGASGQSGGGSDAGNAPNSPPETKEGRGGRSSEGAQGRGPGQGGRD